MAVSDGFRDYVLEQLRALPGVSLRRMFGGAGLYQDGVFFAVMDDDQLFLKVNDATRPRYEKAGSKPFHPIPTEAPSRGYYEVPPNVIDDRDDLAEWAREAVGVGKQAKGAKKKPMTRKPAMRKTPVQKKPAIRKRKA